MAAKHESESLSIGTYLLVKVAWIRKPYLMLVERIDTQAISVSAVDQPHFALQIPRIEGRTLEQISMGDGGRLY